MQRHCAVKKLIFFNSQSKIHAYWTTWMNYPYRLSLSFFLFLKNWINRKFPIKPIFSMSWFLLFYNVEIFLWYSNMSWKKIQFKKILFSKNKSNSIHQTIWYKPEIFNTFCVQIRKTTLKCFWISKHSSRCSGISRCLIQKSYFPK